MTEQHLITPPHEPDELTQLALQMLFRIERMELIIPEITGTIRKALEQCHPTPQPPAAGEVAELAVEPWYPELAAKLRKLAPQNPLGIADPTITCAAELLQLQHPQPVAVSERPWERDGWCDEQGRCWLQGKIEGDWRLINPIKSGWIPLLKYCFSRSLPAHALPLPTSEEVK